MRRHPQAGHGSIGACLHRLLQLSAGSGEIGCLGVAKTKPRWRTQKLQTRVVTQRLRSFEPVL